jgi:Flp pilus assembly pilin Flp
MTVRTLDMNVLPGLCVVVRGDSGQDLIEYALLAAILALGTIVATQGLAGSIINTFFVRIVDMLTGIV